MGNWRLTLLVVIGCLVAALGLFRVLLRGSNADGLGAGRRTCEKMIHGLFRVVQLDEPTERDEGKLKIFTWAANKIHVQGRSGFMVGRSGICKFDVRNQEVTYLGFD